MKKILLYIFLVLILLTAVSCSNASAKEPKPVSSQQTAPSKITIVATLFPQYDFARTIAGDHADVTLLLPPGAESHSFDPRPSDIIAINNADLFVYTGEHMETWAKSIVDAIPAENNVTILDVSSGIILDKSAEIHTEDDGHTAEEHQLDENKLHEYDPHIWTSPVNAKQMAANILASLCQVDPENSDYYTANAEKLSADLSELDQEIKNIVSAGKRKNIYFGGRFALHYFTEEYGLIPKSAYDNCSAETEPSVADMAEMINDIKANSIPIIYFEELTDPKVARAISEETGAEMLLFHSAHNLTKTDFESGTTYLEIMNQNAANLKKGLQ